MQMSKIIYKEKECELNEEQSQQLSIINKTKQYTYWILISILISLYLINIQKEKYLCAVCGGDNCECLPDEFPLRIVANLTATIPVIFLFYISRQNYENDGDNCSNQYNYVAATLILFAALIRLKDILDRKFDVGGTVSENELVLEDIEDI